MDKFQMVYFSLCFTFLKIFSFSSNPILEEKEKIFKKVNHSEK